MLLHRLVSAAVHRPLRTLLLTTVAITALAYPARQLRTDNSLAVWFVDDDPALVRYRAFLERFGNDEAVAIAYPAPAGPTVEELELQRRLVERLSVVEGVDRVMSAVGLLDAESPEADDDGGDRFVATLERLGLAAPAVLAVYAWMEPRADLDADRRGILESIRSAVDETLGGEGRTARLAGTGVLYEGLNRQTERDGAIFLALAVLIMTMLLRPVLGSWRAVTIALAAPIAATAATVGIVALRGDSMNVVMATLPALILVIGIADAVHILLEWFRARRAAPPETVAGRRALAADVVARMAVPCLITSVTTALGFLALASSRMAVIRQLGIYAAIAVMLVWALAVLACALGLSLVRVPAPRRAFGVRLVGPMARLGARIRARRRAVWLGFGIAALALGLGATRLVVDTHTLGLLPRDHEVVRDSEWIEDRLGPYTPLEFVVRAPGGGTVLETEVLAGIAAWQRAAESRPEVGRTLAVTGLGDLGEPGDLGDPGDAGTLGDAGDPGLQRGILADYLTEDRTATRVTAFVPMGTAREFAATVEALEREGDRLLGAAGAFTPAGYLPLYVRIIDYTVQSAITGLVLAFAAVFVVLAVLLGSVRLVAAAVPPNLFAVLTVFGVMGWLRIPLDIATATVGAIILGIAVDDTVHFLHRYRHAERGVAPGDPLGAALTGAGPAMLLTSAVLVLGLGVLMAAGSRSIVYFGLVTALAVASALVADLLLLPALLRGRRT